MGKFEWHEKGIKVTDLAPAVRVAFRHIKVNKEAVRRFFKDSKDLHVRIAFDARNGMLAIKSTHSTDKRFGFRVNDKKANFGSFSCPSFIAKHSLYDPSSTTSQVYTDLSWDAGEDCLIVRGVKQFIADQKPAKAVSK